MGRLSRRGFTLIELLVVISVIGVLAGLIIGISGAASSARKIAAVQGKLKELELAIEGYKSSVGSYPPDAKILQSGGINTVTNQLYYELTGTVFNRQSRLFLSSSGGDGIGPNVCRRYFGVQGFQNTATESSKSKSFLEVGSKERGAIGGRPSVNLLVAPILWPISRSHGYGEGQPEAVWMESRRPIKSNDVNTMRLTPWQYRATSRDRYNLQSFDLWAEFPHRGKLYQINNWSTDPKVFDPELEADGNLQ